MRQLRFADVEERRSRPGEAALLFLTDRCPVGCLHCSVDSRSDSPRVRDLGLLEELVSGLCRAPSISMVGISGGEPFTERRALELAVRMLRESDTDIVLYTSGYWAAHRIPPWVPRVVAAAGCVFLSTDGYHQASVTTEAWVRAARTVASHGVWLVVQVIDDEETVAGTLRLASRAFGDSWAEWMEIHRIPLLPVGRAAAWANRTYHERPGKEFAACKALSSAVFRYDGSTSACCNERVIMGGGPPRLRPRCRSGDDVVTLIESLQDDAVLSVIRNQGLGTLTEHPAFADLANRRFMDMCELCWVVQDRVKSIGQAEDPLLWAIAILGSPSRNDAAASPTATDVEAESS